MSDGLPPEAVLVAPPEQPSLPVRSLIPILLVAAAAVGVYAYRRHERRVWEARRISGGRKALALGRADRR